MFTLYGYFFIFHFHLPQNFWTTVVSYIHRKLLSLITFLMAFKRNFFFVHYPPLLFSSFISENKKIWAVNMLMMCFHLMSKQKIEGTKPQQPTETFLNTCPRTWLYVRVCETVKWPKPKINDWFCMYRWVIFHQAEKRIDWQWILDDDSAVRENWNNGFAQMGTFSMKPFALYGSLNKIILCNFQLVYGVFKIGDCLEKWMVF